MYGLAEYWKMMTDHVRRDAYAEALQRTVDSNSVVLNIGTGVGVFALLACQFGARRVYAIEPHDVINVARDLAAQNGFSDRIEFIQGMSTEVSLPEPVDVIVSDLRGVLPLQGPHLPTIRDARRFLAPGGTFIPARDVIHVGVLEAPALYRSLVTPWGDRPHGLVFDSAQRHATGRWTKARFSADELLLAPQVWADLDYASIDEPNISAELRWSVERGGTAHGLGAWFDAHLIDGVSFTTGPSSAERIYGSGFFPWSEPVVLEPRSSVKVRLTARLFGDAYLWRWETEIRAGGEDGPVLAQFDQSNV
jgi:protein arginine N-methyltransferase 1